MPSAPPGVPQAPPFSLFRLRRFLPRFVTDSDWTKGMIRDAPRTSLPPGSVFNSTDFLLHQPGIAQKRGGTSYAGPALTGATYAAAVVYADFPAGAKLCAVDDRGHLFTVTSGTTTDVNTMGSAFVTKDKPKLKVGSAKNLLVITANDGTTLPKTYNGVATVATLGGTPPAAIYAAIYKNRLVLANGTASGVLNNNRAWFSGSPDIESAWDLANSWVDFDNAITGMAALQNALLVFSNGKLERLTGATPPPGTDFDRAPVANVGCTDARSISVWNGNAIFANPDGIYMSNGGDPSSLTVKGGISLYWQALLAAYDPSTWTIATGLYGDYLFVSVMNGATLIDTLVCNLPRTAWFRLTNIKALMFSRGLNIGTELYYADRSTNRVTALSGIFSPAAGNKNDANGTAVAPMIELRPSGASPDLTHYGFGEISYDMRDAASDNPTLAVQVAPGIEATTFAAVAESPLAKTTDETRKRFTVAKISQAVTLRLTQTNASSKTELYLAEVEIRALPAIQGGQ